MTVTRWPWDLEGSSGIKACSMPEAGTACRPDVGDGCTRSVPVPGVDVIDPNGPG